MASIQKHGNKWRVKWRDEHGRVLYEAFTTEKQADKARRRVEARTELDGKPPVVASDAMTLAKWWSVWEPGRQWRDSSRKTHAYHWRRYVRPVFGRVPVDQIRTADIRQFQRKLEKKGLSASTVAAVHRTLSMCLQGAVEDELLPRNPARAARLARQTRTPVVAFDGETEARMLDAIATVNAGLDTYARLIAETGMRRAEAAGVTWDRVDIEKAELVVDRQLVWGSTAEWGPTKNNVVRTVPLSDAAVALLKAHKASQSVVAIRDALVFTRDDGRPWPRYRVEETWRDARKLLADAGTPLPAQTRAWHLLRHTVGSRLLEAGVPPADVAAMLGHTVKELLATYAHITDRTKSYARIRAALA